MKKISIAIGIDCSCTNGGGYNKAIRQPLIREMAGSDQPDSFLNQLAMNYRSYAIFNARQSGYPDIGENVCAKSHSCFFRMKHRCQNPWEVGKSMIKVWFLNYPGACQELVNMLKNDMSDYCPVEAAEPKI